MNEPPEIPELPDPDRSPRDGIREDDHPIPAWFNAAFGVCVAFAVVYFPYYTFVSDWSARADWQAETAAARVRADALRAALPERNPYRGNALAVAEGAEIFRTICASCHQLDASGLVGPSLVDGYWKYGHDDAALYETVSNGRPGGMPAWVAALGGDKIWKALAYLETLPRSERPGLGAPDYVAPGAASPAVP